MAATDPSNYRKPPQWATSSLSMRLKNTLTHAGKFFPETLIYALDAIISYLAVGRWLYQKGYRVQRFKNRDELFQKMASLVQEDRVLYLEFGVFEGYTMRRWARLLKDKAQARLHGFDSFEGLPEHWNEFNPKAKFSTDGRTPEINDPRVRFIKGWFNESLPKYELPEHERKIINIDCDLYSSAKYVLDYFKESIEVGDLIYFDEFYDRHHELKAFHEFLLENPRLSFECVGASLAIANCAFRRTA